MRKLSKVFEKFSKAFEIFFKKVSRKLQKCIILAYFSNKLTNYALLFSAFGRKTQIVGKFSENFEIFWWKFYRKIKFFIFIFYFYFENLLLKIEFSEITPFFYNNFFGFGGGGEFPPFPPWLRPCLAQQRARPEPSVFVLYCVGIILYYLFQILSKIIICTWLKILHKIWTSEN